MFRITCMDHIVLNVENMDTVLDFYTNVLGLEPERLEEFRQGKVGFPSVRLNATTVIDLFPVKEPAPDTAVPLRTDLNHFCMVVNKADMPEFIDHLKVHGVTIEEGPAQRWGAQGTGISVYFCDPEKRRIEVRYYDN
jgi:catechol 2,3-dioxygenase-like lactoylglutathione lyase family enzyme